MTSQLFAQAPFKLICIEQTSIQIRRFIMEKNSNAKTSGYKFSQIFGYKGPNETVQEEDIITCLKFDNEGKFIALGDKAGRVIIFENTNSSQKNTNQLDYFTEFQSHLSEFDPLRSMNIDEEIVDISWLSKQGKYLKMATTNSRSIKLWKIFQKFEKKVIKSSGKDLCMPKLQNVQANYTAEIQKNFPNKHLNPIKQISHSNNEQFMLSTDQAQTFLWDLQRPDKPYIVCDFTESASKAEDNRETITCCQMHPKSDSMFLYGMSKGSLKLGDLRISANGESNSICFKTSGQKNFLLNLISNISSATFTKNCKYIVSRDYMTVKIWDVCNTKKPVNSILLHEGMKSKLCEMAQNEAIYDEFKISVSSDSSTILTGNYNNSFHMLDFDGVNSQYELNYKKSTICKNLGKGLAPLTKIDYKRKVIVNDYNPTRNMAAVASLNCFFTYSL